MKKMILFSLMLAAAVFCAACGAPAEIKSANLANTANANASKPVSSAPTKEDLMALDKQANEAWKNHDTKFFETFLDDKFSGYGMKGRWDKAGALKGIAEHKCDVKGFTLDDTQMKVISPEVAVLTYKVTTDGTCEGHKIEPARSSTVFVKRGDKWMGAYHSETTIVEPKAPASSDKKAEMKKEDDTAKEADEVKTGSEEKKPRDTRSGLEAKAAAPAAPAAPGAAPASNAAKPANDASMTDALAAIEKSGWEAWKSHDAQKLQEVTTKDLSFADAMGKYFPDKASTIAEWTKPGSDVKSVNISDSFSVSLTADVAILLFKGTAAGTCEGEKIGALYGATVYQKDGDAWKAAFITQTPAK